TAWSQHGKGAGEFDTPHGIALDSMGRVYVADRANNRIQIFEPDGKFVAEWKQFGRPSDVFIDKNDMIYVADSQSTPTNNPGFKPQCLRQSRQHRLSQSSSWQTTRSAPA